MRQQFYGMTLLSYGLGAIAAVRILGAAVSWPIFLLGFAGLFSMELGAVLLNEYHDQDTDRRNKNAGPFTGGSRVLVETRLPPERVRRVSQVVLAGSLIMFSFMLLIGGAGWDEWLRVGALVGIGMVLAPGYTAPPLSLV
jgi:4-hydroxybenzoate polyprenyltransferase